MDEYLDEEIEYVKQCFEMICRGWEKTVSLVILMTISLLMAHIDGARSYHSNCKSRPGTVFELAQSGTSETERARVIHRRSLAPSYHRTADHSCRRKGVWRCVDDRW